MKEKSNLKGRIGWLDLAKTLAIFSIVANHAVNRAYPVTVNSYQDHLLFSIERAVIFAFSRIGVPFFFMITGGFITSKKL
ncbi:MAG: acyltransferase family protein [Erysipelothrix sp.]|nr:acyltransferase family protein [Erysipelothrix sp.]